VIRLGDALGGWKPLPGGGGDPLATIRAAWAELVGADVAAAAQPVALQGDALVVMAASSAWSHQLTFLAPEIVRGLRALPGCAEVARLRFRVGAVRAPGKRRGAPARPRRAAAPGALPRTVPASAAEALASLRASIERSRAAHAAAGGTFCERCAAPIAEGRQCVPCADTERRERTETAERLLYDAPWLAPAEVIALVPGLDEMAYDTIRRRLLRAWWDELALARRRASLPRPVAPDRARLRKLASSYVLLETRLDPNRLDLDSPVRRNALGELYEFVREVEGAV
jgi:hypothetical protein